MSGARAPEHSSEKNERQKRTTLNNRGKEREKQAGKVQKNEK
jgi:hypothetical protein